MDASRAHFEISRSIRAEKRRIVGAAFCPTPEDMSGTAGPELRLLPIWLRFADPLIEREFRDEYLTRALPAIRLFLTAAGLLYAVFGVLDHSVIADIETIAWTIRYAVVCPLFVATILLTYTRYFGRIAQSMLCLNMVAAGAGVIVMT